MYIRQVHISGVGPLKDFSVDLNAPGLNILLGPNECGKSTLCEAIDAILYGFEKKESVAQLRSWGGSEGMHGTLILEVKGAQRVRIVRDFETNHTTVHQLEDEQLLFGGDANPRGLTEYPRMYRELLTSGLGAPLRSVFHSGGYVGQLQLELEIDDALRRQISGAGQADSKQAEQRLTEQYYALTREPLAGEHKKHKDRRIEGLQEEIRSQTAALQLARMQSIALADVREERAELEAQKSNLLVKHDVLSKHVQALQTFLALLEDWSNVSQREEAEARQRNQVERLQREVGDLESQLSEPRYGLFIDQSAPTLSKLRRYLHSDAEQTLRQIEHLRTDLDHLRKELSNERYAVLRDAPQETGEQLRALQQNCGRLKELQALQSAKDLPRRHLRWGWVAGASIVGAVLGLGLGWLLQGSLGMPIRMATALMAGALAGGLLLGILGLLLQVLRRRQSTSGQAQTLALEAQVIGLKTEQAALEQSLGPVLQGGKTSLDVLLERWTWVEKKRADLRRLIEKQEVLMGQAAVQLASDPDLQPILAVGESGMLAERLAQFETLRERLAAKRDTLDGLQPDLLDTSGQSALRRDLKSVVLRLEHLLEANPSFIAYREDPAAGLSLLESEQTQLKDVSQVLEGVNGRLHALDVKVAGLQVQKTASPSVLEEDLEQMHAVLGRLRMRASALALSLEVLRESIIEYEGDHLHRLAVRASTYFHRFTGGRYAGVELPAGGGVQVRETGERVLANRQLSAGARDQLFFALRLAVSDLLVADMQMPLLLDDPFVNFDEERLAAARQVLEVIAAERQVILLAHDARFREWPGLVQQFRDCLGN